MNLKKFVVRVFGKVLGDYWVQLFEGYEEEVKNFYKKHGPYKISVDIGAGVGYHTKRLSKISEKVIAIEPIKQPELPENVEFYHKAVGLEEGKKNMKIEGTHMDGSPGAETKFDSEGEIEVEVVPLDSIVTEADFLKVDIEGYEEEALKNSKLINNVEYAVIETHGSFPLSILSDFDVRKREKKGGTGNFLFCEMRK